MVNSKRDSSGFVLAILMMAVFVLALSLTIAIPVWETEFRREREAELVFRGRQYVEAIRIFQLKNPGRFPSSLEELKESICIRQLYKDPVSKSGDWDVILNQAGASANPAEQILVAPAAALSSLQNPVILGVVSSSQEKSIRFYENQGTYNHWLFYLGHDPKKQPRIVYYGAGASEGNEAKEE